METRKIIRKTRSVGTVKRHFIVRPTGDIMKMLFTNIWYINATYVKSKFEVEAMLGNIIIVFMIKNPPSKL